MPYFGRRRIYLVGMMTMATTLVVIGILNVWGERAGVGYVQAALCLFWTFTFQLSVGQLGWALPAEVGSTKLRQKTICLARNFYYLGNTVCSVLQSYFINPTAWALSGYTGKWTSQNSRARLPLMSRRILLGWDRALCVFMGFLASSGNPGPHV